MRHADAGYDEARQFAEKSAIDLPSLNDARR